MDERSGKTTHLSLSRTLGRKICWAGGLAAFLGLALLVLATYGLTQAVHVGVLEARTSTLGEELLAFEDKAASISDRIGEIAERDAQLRTLAGLDPLDPEVLMAGVGGPGSPTLETYYLDELDSTSRTRAFGISDALDEATRRADILLASLTAAVDEASAKRDMLESLPSIKPAAGWIASGFSQERLHPIHNLPLPHHGVDISGVRGSQVWATAKGRVIRASNLPGYGLTVDIDHGYGFVTRYAHADKLLVRVGQMVKRGDPVGLMGNTGTSTSTHVHYEVHVNGVPRNPMNYFFPEEIRD